MKKTFTILIAAIAAIMLITQPLKVVGQTRTDLTISYSNFSTVGSGTGYSAYDGTHTEYTPNIVSSNVMVNGNYLQFKKNGGNIYNSSATAGRITSITLSESVGLTIYVGTSSQPSTTTTTSGATITGDYTYFKIINSTSSAITVGSITVAYSSGPSITASNVTIKASDTSGEISYSVSSPVTGGEMSAAEKTAIDWIDDVTVDASNNKVTFTASENTSGEERSGTITLTYTYTPSKATVTKDVTVTQKRYYTATFNGNGGATAGSATTYTQNVSDGLTAPLTANQFVNGLKAFKHWNTDKDDSALGTDYADEAEYTFSEDITLYAIWAESYSVTYKANGGTGDDIVNNYAEGNNAPIASNTFTAPSGKMFVKWYTKDTDDGTGTAYQPGDEIENIGDNYTLYAIWADKCTLTLNSNGMTTTFDVPQEYEYDFPTPSNVPEGYVYKGWSTNSSAAAEGVYKFTPAASTAEYFAVFGEIEYGDFSKVSSEPEDWSGRYLIVAEAGNKAFNGTISSNWGQCSNVTITSNTINTTGSGCAPANGLVIISAGATDDTYKFKFYDNSYMDWTDAKKFSSGETGEDYTISYSSGDVEITSSEDNYIQYNSSEGKIRSYASEQTAVQLYKQAESISSYTTTIASPTISGDIEITTPTTISSSQTFSGDLDITETLTIGGSAVVAVEGSITNASAANLVIEDGGQLILPDNATVAATMKKTTSASTEETKDAAVNKWYAISTPVSEVAISSFIPTTVGAKWNVYRYDETEAQWEEYRDDNNQFTTLESGRGYLYRATENNLAFAGNVNAGDENGEVKYDLSYAYAGSNNDFKGFNLLGNPFTHEITWSNLVTTNVEDDGYYLLIEEEGENQGKWSATASKTTPIAPMQAFLVQANNTGAKVTIKNHVSLKGEMKGYSNDIMFAVKNGEQSDEAYVLFKDGKGLNKVNHRNAEIPMLYVVNNGEKFAIADMNTDTKVINLGFEAKYIAKYTLSLKANGNFSYLHLIDKLTGEDVDMLLEGEYSFMASPTDNPERFIVRLEYSEGSESSESSYAYQNGSDIIVSGEGELQVFDVTGRMVKIQRINGVQTINLNTQGVYIFKLNDKVQKVVVR